MSINKVTGVIAATSYISISSVHYEKAIVIVDTLDTEPIAIVTEQFLLDIVVAVIAVSLATIASVTIVAIILPSPSSEATSSATPRIRCRT